MILVSKINEIIRANILAQGDDFMLDNILFDSRKLAHPETSIFIPIITNRRNGHHFMKEVYDAGVRCFFVSEMVQNTYFAGAWIFRVDHPLNAMQQLVAWHRAQFSLPVVGITGSNGKTIVKEWLNQLLEHDFDLIRSPKSYNSQLGVALSVWQIQAEHNFAIIEAGISQVNEMERLEMMIKPTFGIFTNIGETHNEGFIDVSQKINEKLLLFKHAEHIIYNKDYEELHQCVEVFIKTQNRDLVPLTWSKKVKADLQIVQLKKENKHSRIIAVYQSEEIEIQIPFTDDAYIEDSIHCWLTLLFLNIPHTIIQHRMKSLAHIAMRLELMKGINDCTIINDSYSSDLSSFSIALDLLSQQNQHKKRTVILSDIFQSGKEVELYKEVADLIKQKKIQRFIGIGDMLAKNQSSFVDNPKLEVSFFPNTEAFLAQLDKSNFVNEGILIKGARSFQFERIALEMQERIHQTVLEINLDSLIHNYKTFQSLLKKETKIMAMVKAFSYGSGSFEVANKLQFEGVDYLAVAYTDEGIDLRKNGITLPIMVMNPDEHSFDQLIEFKLEPEIYNFKTLHKIIETTRLSECNDYPIHIKLDTGMHRLGFDQLDIEQVISLIKDEVGIKVVSVFSHLSGSEEPELDQFTAHQAKLFTLMSNTLQDALGYSFLRHLCNSSGIARHPELHFDMVRLGLGLYGVDGSGKWSNKLQTVSTLKTVISQIKIVPADETVGYNRKGILKRDTKIGTVCVGYADGISRRLGNGIGRMMIHNQLVPIVGNVCMDMCMLDITDLKEVHEGDQVLIFGESLTVSQVAKWAETIPYEILTSISQRVKRVYFEG